MTQCPGLPRAEVQSRMALVCRVRNSPFLVLAGGGGKVTGILFAVAGNLILFLKKNSI